MSRLEPNDRAIEHGGNTEPTEGELLPRSVERGHSSRLLKRTTRHREVLLANETVVVEEWAGTESGDV